MTDTAIPGDETGIFSAICSQPAEDTPRLAYADWLDERAERDSRILTGPDGQTPRAEFIRVQVEISRYGPRQECCDRAGNTITDTDPKRAIPCDCAWAVLCRREYELFKSLDMDGETRIGQRTVAFPYWHQWQRGFPAVLEHLYANLWCEIGDELLTKQPICEVRLLSPLTPDRTEWDPGDRVHHARVAGKWIEIHEREVHWDVLGRRELNDKMNETLFSRRWPGVKIHQPRQDAPVYEINWNGSDMLESSDDSLDSLLFAMNALRDRYDNGLVFNIPSGFAYLAPAVEPTHGSSAQPTPEPTTTETAHVRDGDDDPDTSEHHGDD